MHHFQNRAAVMNLALDERFDLTGTPPAPPRCRSRRIAEAAGDRVPQQPGDLISRRVPGGQRTRRERTADPVGLLGPFADLAAGDRLVLEPEHLLAGLVGPAELSEHA